MSFSELNSVEYYIIHQLSGTNLNDSSVADPVKPYGSQWVYKSAASLQRETREILL